jgi:glutaredoxin
MIILYGTRGCGKCRVVKQILIERKVNFEYRDFDDIPPDEHQAVWEMCIAHNILSFPVMVKDGVVLKEIPKE